MPRRGLLLGMASSAALACSRRAPPPATDAPLGAVGATSASGAKRLRLGPIAPAGAVLEAAAWTSLEAALARILPSGQSPGARDTGVIRFLDRQLATRELAVLAPAMRRIAQALDQTALQRRGVPYARVSETEQDAILGDLAQGMLEAPGLPQREAFAALHTLALEGHLSDPVHGGNAGELGWRAVGFETPPLRAPGDGDHHAHGHPAP